MQNWRFRLCGVDSGTIVLSNVGHPSSEELNQDLLLALHSDPQSEVRFHFESESCAVQRPVRELFRDWVPEQLGDSHVLIHPSQVAGFIPLRQSDSQQAPAPHAAAHQPTDGQEASVSSAARLGEEDSSANPSVSGAPSVADAAADDTDAATGDSGISCKVIVKYDPKYKFEPKLAPLKLDPAIWTPTEIPLKLSDSVATPKEVIKAEVLDRVQEDLPLQRHFDPTKNASEFRTDFHVEGHDVEVNLDMASHGARFLNISDLFTDVSQAQGSKRNANVLLSFGDVAQPEQSAFEKAGKAKRRKTLNPQPTIREDFDKHVRPEDEANPHSYIRVGTMKARTELLGGVDVEFAIVGRLNNANEKLVELVSVPAWDFGSICIGDVEEGPGVDFDDRDDWTWSLNFAGAPDEKALEKRIFEPTAGHPRLPFLPAMTFNVFDPTTQSPTLGVDLGEKQIPVVYRYVEHLQRTTKELKLHNNAQASVEASYTAEQVLENVRQQLMEWESPLVNASGDVVGGYGLELWVLPQERQPHVLYRFPTERPGSSGALQEFLSERMVAAGDSRLYIEVHIWPSKREAGSEEEGSGEESETES
ncbi:hypothetical protein LTR85_004795 [Meristemomyces frigidus]|nr:hypothetical protein LTR85_004795 [Meristemomyces frigidus]